MSMRQMFGRMNRTLSKHSTEMLLIGGAVSLVYSGVKIIQATIKSTREIDAKLAEKQRKLDEQNYTSDVTPRATMDQKEIVKEVWKNYIPAVAAAAFGFACMFEADHIHRRGKSALLTLYALSEADRIDFKKKTEELIGKNKTQEIQQDVEQDRVFKETSTMDDKVDVIETGHGSTLIKDAFSGRYFRCSYEYIRKKCNDLTYRLWSSMEMELNSLYFEIPNMEPAECGDMVGWVAEDGPIEPYFTSTFSAWGEPCAVMRFEVPPHYLR